MTDQEPAKTLRLIYRERTRVSDPSALHHRVLGIPSGQHKPRFRWQQILGRSFQPVFSLAKFVLAVAIVALFGGFLLTGVLTTQPADEEAAAGAVADPSVVPAVPNEASAPSAAVEFTGTIAFGPCTGVTSSQYVDRVTRTRGADDGRFCRPAIIEPFSDPRLQGEVFVWQNDDQHFKGPTVFYSGFSIKNDQGTWQQIPGVGFTFSDRTAATGIHVFEGTGAYEGLLAVAEIGLDQDVWTWRGWIIDGELPSAPEPPAEAR